MNKRKEDREILMVISDGAPVDDSTLSTNTSDYLETNLKKTVKWIESKSNIELLAIGIGHDVTRYYNRAVKITDVQDLGDVMINQLTELFESPNVTVNEIKITFKTLKFHYGPFTTGSYQYSTSTEAIENGNVFSDSPFSSYSDGTISLVSHNSNQTVYSWTPTESSTQDVLVVAGGGGGGYDAGGGGGAGGFLTVDQESISGTYTITVGNGGQGSPGGRRGYEGYDSIISGSFSLTSKGGGGGASYHNTSSYPAGSGGSGGGGSGGRESHGTYGGSAGGGTSGQGTSGANSGVTWYAGGGGGAGESGKGGGYNTGHGGNGKLWNNSGYDYWFSGGGGSSGFSSISGNGGKGGGGSGAGPNGVGEGDIHSMTRANNGLAGYNVKGGNGAKHSGGGGGGGAHSTGSGGDGGSGVVFFVNKEVKRYSFDASSGTFKLIDVPDVATKAELYKDGVYDSDLTISNSEITKTVSDPGSYSMRVYRTVNSVDYLIIETNPLDLV